jgi:hypothetical protein
VVSETEMEWNKGHAVIYARRVKQFSLTDNKQEVHETLPRTTFIYITHNSYYNNTLCILQLPFSFTAQVALVRKHSISDTFVITEFALT